MYPYLREFMYREFMYSALVFKCVYETLTTQTPPCTGGGGTGRGEVGEVGELEELVEGGGQHV